jgi:hypothetical protein
MVLLDRWRRPKTNTWPATYRGGLPDYLGAGEGVLRLADNHLEFRYAFRPQRLRISLDGANVEVHRYPKAHASSSIVPVPTHPSEPMLVVSVPGDPPRTALFQMGAAEQVVAAVQQKRLRAIA